MSAPNPALESRSPARRRWIRPLRLAIFLTLLGLVAAAAWLPGLPHRRILLLVAVSAFVGWGTNWVAIWFLFHRFLGLPGTGVIPRNKEKFFKTLALRTRELLDQSGLVEAVRDKVDAHLQGPEWKSLLGERVDRVLDELGAGVRGLPAMIAKDEALSGRIRAIVYDAVDDFGRADRHVAARQDLRRAVVSKLESVLPEVLKQLRSRVRKEIRENLDELGTIKRLLVEATAGHKIKEAPTALTDQIETLILEYVHDDDSMDEAVRRAIEGTSKSLRENNDLEPIVARGLAAGSDAMAAGLEKGRLRDEARAEILRRIDTDEFRGTITSTFAARVKEFVDQDMETRLQSVLGEMRDEEIEGRFREMSDTYFLWIELWGGVLGAVGGVVAAALI